MSKLERRLWGSPCRPEHFYFYPSFFALFFCQHSIPYHSNASVFFSQLLNIVVVSKVKVEQKVEDCDILPSSGLIKWHWTGEVTGGATKLFSKNNKSIIFLARQPDQEKFNDVLHFQGMELRSLYSTRSVQSCLVDSYIQCLRNILAENSKRYIRWSAHKLPWVKISIIFAFPAADCCLVWSSCWGSCLINSYLK